MTDILARCFSPSADVVESVVGDETVILHLGNGTYYGLDRVGTRIWRLLKGQTAMVDICQALAIEYQVELSVIQEDARRFLADLEAQGILVDV